MPLKLYNTLTHRKEDFVPLDPKNVRIYVCGPTVYDYAHIGNARPVIVFDVLFRLLRHLYGESHVTYVRNITDVDDKINARASEEGVPIRDLTERTARQFQKDIAALGVLPPTLEPRATEHIAEMIALIEKLLASGHAYAADGHVLFDVTSTKDYGRLSRRSLDEMIAGARVDVAPYKKGDMDFVLWKPSDAATPGWDSPWGRGRPGWHIECSAMSWKHLGETFDIHGGGIDLLFPHHENELAQTRCAFGTKLMANIWMHNGFLQVEGQKMSKSLGNFVTMNELLNSKKFGGLRWHGQTLRLEMLVAHYRQPFNFTLASLRASALVLDTISNYCRDANPADGKIDQEVLKALSSDLNTPAVLTRLNQLWNLAKKSKGYQKSADLHATLLFLGFNPREYDLETFLKGQSSVPQEKIEALIAARLKARKAKNWAESDRIRDELAAMGIAIKDNKDGTTTWEVKR
jgi:cysteinyl-tRNA synthetase